MSLNKSMRSSHQCSQIAPLEIIHSNDGMDPIKLSRHDNSGVGSRFRITDFSVFPLFLIKAGEINRICTEMTTFLRTYSETVRSPLTRES